MNREAGATFSSRLKYIAPIAISGSILFGCDRQNNIPDRNNVGHTPTVVGLEHRQDELLRESPTELISNERYEYKVIAEGPVEEGRQYLRIQESYIRRGLNYLRVDRVSAEEILIDSVEKLASSIGEVDSEKKAIGFLLSIDNNLHNGYKGEKAHVTFGEDEVRVELWSALYFACDPKTISKVVYTIDNDTKEITRVNEEVIGQTTTNLCTD